MHPSLLPRYRGAAPIAHTLLNGDRETAVTVIALTQTMDAGDILHQVPVAVAADVTYPVLAAQLAAEGAAAIAAVVADLDRKLLGRTPQVGTPTRAPKISKVCDCI
jgi:methionyl-tRNA formyltransferase